MTESHFKKLYFLGRQPILDSRREIIGYELLFRSSFRNAATIISHDVASASVISNVLAGFGFTEVVGEKIGFINVHQPLFFSELLEVLPHERTVLELLEMATMDERIRDRCLQLKKLGFRLSVGDHPSGTELERVSQVIDIVKLDIQGGPREELEERVRELLQLPVRLVAEKVETEAEFEMCLKMGFHLFQGYFFERPEMLRRDCIEPAQLEMLQLLERLKDNADVFEIEEIFRRSPSLSLHLLKLVNSVTMGLRQKVQSLRHAITLLGMERLRRWVHLALFASADTGNRGLNNPLLEMAAVRGRLMEYLVIHRHGKISGFERSEAAFITGIFSLFDVLFETPMAAVIEGLNLDDEITSALLHREGELGQLLLLSEMVERVEFEEVERLLEVVGISIEELVDAQLEAFNWRSLIGQ